MFREALTIDLPTIMRVARAENLDILLARAELDASRGRLESAVGAAFPALVPTALFEHVDGTVRATEGRLVGVGFNTFQASIAVQWVLNPGRVIYEIIAAKKRLQASEHQEQAVIMETLRAAAVQYYALVLGQAEVAAAHQSVGEARELLRINQLRSRTGTGVPAEELRAEAQVAERRQDLTSALQRFYDASVALALTLRLEPTITLVPARAELTPVQLIRTDLSIEELLGYALQFRPDLKSVRMLAQAAADDKGATWWGDFGPQFQVGYQYGGITGHANNVIPAEGVPGNLIVNPLSDNGSFTDNPLANGAIREGILRGTQRAARRQDQTFAFSDQQRLGVDAGWRLSLSAFGDLRSADAAERRAILDAERRLDQVKSQVVRAVQAGKANWDLMDTSRQQLTSAQEALRLSEVNLQAGAMTTLDVLQAQDAVARARLRHIQAVVHYNQSQVNLLAALGLVAPESLNPIVVGVTTPGAASEPGAAQPSHDKAPDSGGA
ncbi:MAG: TolC family protein [bacterium]|nr:TolC family protein [bacterium]